jgi:two-component system osmolarity sensor histidine kinase EnvZ
LDSAPTEPVAGAPATPPPGLKRWLRRVEHLSADELMPPTLMSRAFLAIVVPLVLVLAATTYYFYDNHMTAMLHRLAAGLAGEVASVEGYLRDYPSIESRAWAVGNAKRTMGLSVAVEDGAVLTGPGVVRSARDASECASDVSTCDLEQALWQTLQRPLRVDMSAYRTARQISIYVQMRDGVLHVLAPRAMMFTSNTYVFVIWMIGFSILLFGAAAVFLRSQIQSVRRVAQAAEEFGKGRDIPDFTPEGAFEVRQVGRAFNIMRNRIRRQLAQRTEMLAGVSHDLRTPLTRMKLHLALIGNSGAEDVSGLLEDLDEMERMLDAYLAFARGEGTEESVAADLAALLETVVGRFRRQGRVIELRMSNLPADMKLKPLAFERCVGNLLGNALRHGARVAVTAQRVGRSVEVHIDDDGSGIPPDRREEVFRAFHRLEPSRNPRTGGIGLGLTVARDIIRGMGGDIILGDAPIGGLRATVTVPV